MSKTEIRQSALKARRSLPKQNVHALSEEVKEKVVSLPAFARAKVVACYVSKDDEVQTMSIIQTALSKGKRVIVPRVDPASADLQFKEIRSLAELSPGHFHIMEPAPHSEELPISSADLVLVPVIAWDEEGHRVGYGKGYYDRALKSREGAVAVGLAFESQRFDAVPQGPTDASLDMVVTERRVLKLAGDSR